jgi:hypothetical protein
MYILYILIFDNTLYIYTNLRNLTKYRFVLNFKFDLDILILLIFGLSNVTQTPIAYATWTFGVFPVGHTLSKIRPIYVTVPLTSIGSNNSL